MKRLLISLAAIGVIAHAQTATYSSSNRYLTLPSIVVDGTTLSNVVLRLDAGAVVSIGTNAGISDKCAASNFSADKFNAIALGMAYDQVVQLMGCRPDSTKTYRGLFNTTYQWQSSTSYTPYMTVYFDKNAIGVDYLYQDATNPFKTGSGF